MSLFAQDESFLKECDELQEKTGSAFQLRASRRIETLYVIKAQLRFWKVGEVAHLPVDNQN